MKKFIAIVGENNEYRKSLIEFLESNSLCDSTQSVYYPINEFVPEVLRVKHEDFNKNKTFRNPITLADHHVRNFFSKLEKGVFAVSRYTGKILTNPKEATEYFSEVIGTSVYGKNWLIEYALSFCEDFPEGTFVFTDVTIDQAKVFKELLKDEVAILYINEDEVEESAGADVVLKSHDSKGNLKQVQTQLTSKIKKVWNRKET